MKLLRTIFTVLILLILFRFFVRGIFLFGIVALIILLAGRNKSRNRKKTRCGFNSHWPEAEIVTPPQNPEKEIVFLAAKLNGKLTIADICLQTQIKRSTAEKIINKFVAQAVVETKISDKGIMVYFFPRLPSRRVMLDLRHQDPDKIERALMKLAEEWNNRMSIAGICLNTSLTVDEAITIMDRLCEKGTVARETGKMDAVVYYFTEIINEEEKQSARSIWD